MIHTDMPNKKIHQGRNIKRFREMLGIKQDALAYELGEDWNQKKISLLEQKESVEKDILEQVAKILKVPTEAIENFDEDSVINIISNTFNEGSIANATAENIQCTFNPIDKIVVLYDEKIALYERMLKEKDEMMARLEKLVQRK
ncbi:helix-turn-helix transcriptional regulator [Elizabethkingia anophelis]|uniref:helix-turn-helix domain-containing protein n=1 Tax=Elizabethkingia anophelis TaxID=1117645 RepID=UPI0024E1587D|nr:helix-turn-helix transcriptional regulator [Elizabethkingia anophelis]MCT4228949.1 helix-turn-helix transcriptional regulator [Elizabethkingia anophelis]MCT4239675.1 helix-turn-helix transcriptional regulator [Elizabethkingia anophelis]MCT4281754.1 helix-turn-helix transcriptional regulator [Elizabethkingia anophelis]MCT4292339.1 helix-turn-helix transcriptional regulator [Elizabethkingia anophelis]HDP3248930.1 helix-turn-helix transcriptional regulator [Elizabethkingia anophelis]